MIAAGRIHIKMLRLAVLALFALAVADNQCEVGEWSEWSECMGTTPCRSAETRKPAVSFDMPPAKFDKGRIRMQRMMKEKEALVDYERQCIRDGSCPELRSLKSEGPIKCTEGLAGFMPCRNIDQMSFLNFQDMGYTDPLPGDNPRGNDIWGWTDPETGHEYSIMGISGGTSFVRITDPYNPVPLAFLPTHTDASTWRDMKVVDNYAFIVSEAADHGMQVFNLERLRDMTSLQTVSADTHYNKFGNCHNIVANEETKFVYGVGSNRQTSSGYRLCNGGLHAIDVSDPMNPQFAGCFGGDGYVHDAQCIIYRGPDANYFGKEVCFCYNENSFTIVDVTDKNNMFVISKKGYSGYQYTHQGWLTVDQATVLLDDELDEKNAWWERNTKTYMWDVRDLSNPVLKTRYVSSQTAIDHNQYTVGDLTYQANYEAGLRILRVQAQNNNYDLDELAYFDLFPSRTTANFNGAWSVYPYFKSGNIIVSSIDFGLYVLRPDYAAIEDTIGGPKNHGEQTRTRTLLYKDHLAQCPHLVETRECTPTC